jgi:hypothetical protein
MAFQACAAGIDDFPGRYENKNPDGRVIKVRASLGMDRMVHFELWVRCDHGSGVCQWGSATGFMEKGVAHANWATGYSHIDGKFRVEGDHLAYDLSETPNFKTGPKPFPPEHGTLEHSPEGMGGAGDTMRPKDGVHLTGAQAPAGPDDDGSAAVPAQPGEQCVAEPWRELSVELRGNKWSLVRGPDILGSFGDEKTVAQRSLEIIQHHRFDEMCHVGPAHLGMTYWKHRGSVAITRPEYLPGEQCVNFYTDQVFVKNVKGQWQVWQQGGLWLSDFGQDKAGAERAATLIKAYRMNRQCFVTRPNPPFEYWLAEPER